MTENKVDQLFEEFSRIGDSSERSKVSYLLWARLAAGQENKEPDFGKLETSMGENWLAAADRFEKVLKENPNKAFEMAIHLTLLPTNNNQKIEDINKWLRGDGPGMLGRNELRSNLLDYLENSRESSALIEKLDEYISYDFSKVRNGQGAFDDPNCYLSLSTILLGLKLGKDIDSSEKVKSLFEQAELKFKNADVKRVIDYYSELPDTKWLADEFKSFEDK